MLPLMFIFSVISHEHGHVLGGKIVGVNELKAFIYPSYETYPNLGEEYFYEWPKGTIAFTKFQPTSMKTTTPTDFQDNIMKSIFS